MTVADLRKICLALKSVTEDIKWEDHLCFSIGGKMFLISSTGPAPQSVSFKVDDEDFEAFGERKGFIPAPYLARHKWVQVDDVDRIGKTEWKKIATRSYELVGAKLPAKTRKKLGL
jgi:predicted DNA-binding protein (MmcQ/YjbR family)